MLKRKKIKAQKLFDFEKIDSFFYSASLSVIAVTIVLWVTFSILFSIKLNDASFFFISLGIGVLNALMAFTFKKILDLFKYDSVRYLSVLIFSFPLLYLMNFNRIVAIFVVLLTSILGASFLAFRNNYNNNSRKTYCIFPVLGIIIGLIGFSSLIFFYFIEGFVSDVKTISSFVKIPENIESIKAISPLKKGNFKIKQLTYGSGNDLRRYEFGEGADLKTASVNGSAFTGEIKGIGAWLRKNYWGFDSKQLPINARVWYPEGKGPFPLVLIVHGDYYMQNYSDTGYNYLGELLASKGMIVASVDENFINKSWLNIHGSYKKENDARAWILLQHLKKFHEWNNSKNNIFYNKIDTENIALIGHSRGGEAIVHAALFNKLPFYPDNAKEKFNFNYNIKSLVAIAPVDGQYKPGGILTTVENVNYFVMHGSYDGDVTSYQGYQQYERIKYTKNEDYLKSGLYVHGANHGQFNTSWGRNDTEKPFSGFLNIKPVLSQDDQLKIAKIYISSFLDITLKKDKKYLPLFLNSKNGHQWLPKTIYLNQFENSSFRIVANFDEDSDLSTATYKKGKISTNNLNVWKEQKMNNVKCNENKSLFIGWNNNQFSDPSDQAYYKIDTSLIETDCSHALTLSIAESKDFREKEKDSKLIDFTVQLTDTSNQKVTFPISKSSLLQRETEVMIKKSDFLYKNRKSEKVFQTFYFPLEDLSKGNPMFNTCKIKEITFIFDKNEKGLIVIDNIGFMENIGN